MPSYDRPKDLAHRLAQSCARRTLASVDAHRGEMLPVPCEVMREKTREMFRRPPNTVYMIAIKI